MRSTISSAPAAASKLPAALRAHDGYRKRVGLEPHHEGDAIRTVLVVDRGGRRPPRRSAGGARRRRGRPIRARTSRTSRRRGAGARPGRWRATLRRALVPLPRAKRRPGPPPAHSRRRAEARAGGAARPRGCGGDVFELMACLLGSRVAWRRARDISAALRRRGRRRRHAAATAAAAVASTAPSVVAPAATSAVAAAAPGAGVAPAPARLAPRAVGTHVAGRAVAVEAAAARARAAGGPRRGACAEAGRGPIAAAEATRGPRARAAARAAEAAGCVPGRSARRAARPPEGRVLRRRLRRRTDACSRWRPRGRPRAACSRRRPRRRARSTGACSGGWPRPPPCRPRDQPGASTGDTRRRRGACSGAPREAASGGSPRSRRFPAATRCRPPGRWLGSCDGRPAPSPPPGRPGRSPCPPPGRWASPFPPLELVVDAVVDVDVSAVDVAAVEVDVADVAPVDVVPDLVVGPAHRPRRRRAEEHPRTPGHAGAPGVVVPGVGRRVVAHHRQRRGRHHDHRIVLGHVHDLRVGALDRDDFVLRRHRLLRVGHEIPGGLHLAAEALDGVHHLAGIGRDLLAEADRPLEVRGQHVDHVRRVQQVAHALVPGRIGLEGLVLGEAVEEAIRLHHVEGVGRGREHDRQEGIGVEGDRGDELVDGRFGRNRERRHARRRGRRVRFLRRPVALARERGCNEEGEHPALRGRSQSHGPPVFAARLAAFPRGCTPYPTFGPAARLASGPSGARNGSGRATLPCAGLPRGAASP